jgi:hypothetical protein
MLIFRSRQIKVKYQKQKRNKAEFEKTQQKRLFFKKTWVLRDSFSEIQMQVKPSEYQNLYKSNQLIEKRLKPYNIINSYPYYDIVIKYMVTTCSQQAVALKKQIQEEYVNQLWLKEDKQIFSGFVFFSLSEKILYEKVHKFFQDLILEKHLDYFFGFKRISKKAFLRLTKINLTFGYLILVQPLKPIAITKDPYFFLKTAEKILNHEKKELTIINNVTYNPNEIIFLGFFFCGHFISTQIVSNQLRSFSTNFFSETQVNITKKDLETVLENKDSLLFLEAKTPEIAIIIENKDKNDPNFLKSTYITNSLNEGSDNLGVNKKIYIFFDTLKKFPFFFL